MRPESLPKRERWHPVRKEPPPSRAEQPAGSTISAPPLADQHLQQGSAPVVDAVQQVPAQLWAHLGFWLQDLWRPVWLAQVWQQDEAAQVARPLGKPQAVGHWHRRVLVSPVPRRVRAQPRVELKEPHRRSQMAPLVQLAQLAMGLPVWAPAPPPVAQQRPPSVIPTENQQGSRSGVLHWCCSPHAG